MKSTKGTGFAMLELVVIPKIQEIKKLLQMQKTEEAKKIVDKDVWGLLYQYIQSEREKFENALSQFYNMENGQLLPVEEWNPEAAQMYIEGVI